MEWRVVYSNWLINRHESEYIHCQRLIFLNVDKNTLFIYKAINNDAVNWSQEDWDTRQKISRSQAWLR